MSMHVASQPYIALSRICFTTVESHPKWNCCSLDHQPPTVSTPFRRVVSRSFLNSTYFPAECTEKW